MRAVMPTPAQVSYLHISACMQFVSLFILMCTVRLNFAHRLLNLIKHRMECLKEVSLVGVVLSQAALHIIMVMLFE